VNRTAVHGLRDVNLNAENSGSKNLAQQKAQPYWLGFSLLHSLHFHNYDPRIAAFTE
jgi:hypothetical protein